MYTKIYRLAVQTEVINNNNNLHYASTQPVFIVQSEQWKQYNNVKSVQS